MNDLSKVWCKKIQWDINDDAFTYCSSLIGETCMKKEKKKGGLRVMGDILSTVFICTGGSKRILDHAVHATWSCQIFCESIKNRSTNKIIYVPILRKIEAEKVLEKK